MPFLIIFLVLLVSFMILFLIVGIVMLAFDLLLDLPFVATERKKIATILKFAQIKKGQSVVDLGSGDGRLLIAAAKNGACAIGYEINPFLIFLTRFKARIMSLRGAKRRGNLKSRVDRHGHQDDLAMTGWGEIVVKRQNLWKADLAVADVIFVYGRKKTMQKFQDFVYKNAKKGTRIIVNTNSFPTKKPTKSGNGIYLYVA